MDTVSRLIATLVLVVASTAASATQEVCAVDPDTNALGPCAATPAGACTAFAATLPDPGSPDFWGTSVSGTLCTAIRTRPNGTNYFNPVIRTLQSREVSEPTSCPEFGKGMGSATLSFTQDSSSSLMCLNGCKYLPSVMAKQPDGKWAGWGPYTSVGKECGTGPMGNGTPTPGDPPAGEPFPEPPPPGKCPGEVNGVPVVVDCGEAKAPAPIKNTGPAATASSPAGTIPNSKGETGETTCSGGVCTTVTTTKTNNPDGTTTDEPTTTTEPETTFCAKNAGSPLCKEPQKGSFAGSCGATVCSGDAVQCAIAQEQYRRNCELFDANESSARGLLAAAAGDRPGDHPANTAETFSLANGFDKTNLIAGGCPGDQVVSIGGGGSVTLPWSELCSPATWLGNLLVGLTALACLGIVFRTKGG